VAYLVWQRGRPREVITRGRDAGDTAPTRRPRPESAPAATPTPAPAAAETRDGEDAGGDGGRRHTDG
jgi:hypothetical protein